MNGLRNTLWLMFTQNNLWNKNYFLLLTYVQMPMYFFIRRIKSQHSFMQKYICMFRYN